MTEDFDVDELGFNPAISATGADPDEAPRPDRASSSLGARRRPRRAVWRRRFASGVVLLIALIGMGGAYALFATSSGAHTATSTAADVAAGQQLYEVSCITCHGNEPAGCQRTRTVADRRRRRRRVLPGRAPAGCQRPAGRPDGAQGGRSSPRADQPARGLRPGERRRPGTPDRQSARQRRSASANGGDLFRLNCASCHGFAGAGGATVRRQVRAHAQDATDSQIYAAMLTGPQNMPVFSDNQLTSDEKRAIIDYIQT